MLEATEKPKPVWEREDPSHEEAKERMPRRRHEDLRKADDVILERELDRSLACVQLGLYTEVPRKTERRCLRSEYAERSIEGVVNETPP